MIVFYSGNGGRPEMVLLDKTNLMFSFWNSQKRIEPRLKKLLRHRKKTRKNKGKK